MYCAVIIAAQSVELDKPGDQEVCPGEPFTVTCIAVGPGILTWISECYVGNFGNGIIIQFASHTPNNTKNNNTVNPSSYYAVLNSVYNDSSGAQVLNSTFYIVKDPKDGPCTIICQTSDIVQNSTTLRIRGNNNITYTVVLRKRAHGRCTLH